MIKSWLKDSKGQALTEYALIIAIVAIVVIGALKLLGGSITGAFEKAGNEISSSTK